MLAGLLLGLAIVAGALVVRAGPAGWAAGLIALVMYSHNPDESLRALAVGALVWAVLALGRRVILR